MTVIVGQQFRVPRSLINKHGSFQDCVSSAVYKVHYLANGGFIFVDSVNDEVYVPREDYRHLEFIGVAVDKPFHNYETLQDFENIIDYALASNDLALFTECTEELKKRGLLKYYGQQTSLAPTH